METNNIKEQVLQLIKDAGNSKKQLEAEIKDLKKKIKSNKLNLEFLKKYN